MTEGEALGHQWSQATLNMPAVCSVCGAIDGTALNYVYAGHGTVKWNETGYIPFYTAESETSEVLTGRHRSPLLFPENQRLVLHDL